MRGALLVALAVACTPEVDLERVDRAPKAVIVSPSDQSEVRSGAFSAIGRVSDERDDAEHLYTVWSLGRADGAWDDVCVGFAEPDGTTRCVTGITAAHTAVRLRAIDLAGYRGDDVATLRVNHVEPPEVELVEPAGDRPYYADVPIRVVAEVHDPDHHPDELTFAWHADAGLVDGPILPDGDGGLAGEVLLPEGTTRLVLVVTDPDGAEGRAEVPLQVVGPNTPPTARVLAPVDGAGVVVGTRVTLEGAALDDEDPPEVLEATWSSDLDGSLGEAPVGELGRTVLEGVVLSNGDHRLTLTVTDLVGGVARSTVTVHVDTPPVVILVGPADGASLPVGEAVVVEGAISDARTPAEAIDLEVLAGGVGAVGLTGPDEAGVFRALVSLPPGTHAITVRATDAHGLASEVTRTVTLGSE